MEYKEELILEEKIYTQNEMTEAVRAAIVDRATWFYLLLKASEKQGANSGDIAKEAITEFGKMKGKKFGDIKTPGEFINKISEGQGCYAFAMGDKVIGEDKGEIKFRYCALVEAWKNLGCSPEEIKELCKLASYGDFGIVSCFPELNLEFKELLSHGESCCHMVITKNK